MKKMLGPVAGCGLAGVALLAGCQTTNPCGSPSPVSTTANCPPRPPLRQRLFGSVQKPGNCQTCPQLPPGSIPAGSLPPGALPSVSQNSTPTIIGQAGYGPPPVGATLPIVPGPNTTQLLAPLGVVNMLLQSTRPVCLPFRVGVGPAWGTSSLREPILQQVKLF